MLTLFLLGSSIIFLLEIVNMASKQKIIEVVIKVNEAISACRTQKQHPKIQEMNPPVHKNQTRKLF